MKENKQSEHSPAPQPERAIYGFFLLFAAIAVFVIYLVLSIAPDYLLAEYELDFLPGKYWLLAMPAFVALLILFVVPIYCSLNATHVCLLDSVYAVHDEASLTRDTQINTRTTYTQDSIDPIYDLNNRDVNKFLFY